MFGNYEHLAGYIFGSALGDAFGRYVEFLNIARIKEKYGSAGILEPPANAHWTDDTQMMLAIADALIHSHSLDFDIIMDQIASSFIDWLHDPGYSPGDTCLRGVANLRRGIHWSESGIKSSKGCGSVMRSGIIGYFYQHSPEKLRKVASVSGLMTHGHPTADAASIAGAYAVKLALDGVEPKDMLDPLLHITDGISSEFTSLLKRAYDLSQTCTSDYDCLKSLGEGWIAEEAFAMAYFVLLRFPHDYIQAMRLAVNLTGDSDSIGCIAGGIFGALNGIHSIPPSWLAKLEHKLVLDDYIERILNIT